LQNITSRTINAPDGWLENTLVIEYEKKYLLMLVLVEDRNFCESTSIKVGEP